MFSIHYLSDQSKSLLNPIDITTAIEVKPGRYYQTKGHYRLDIRATPRMSLPIKNLPDNIGDYSLLVINNFDGFKSANLYLTAQLTLNQDQSPVQYKQKLLSSRQSVNELNPEWQQATTVSDITLIVESNVSLGFDSPSDDQISWQSIQFKGDKQINPIQQFASEVTAFVPLNYSSINVNNGEVIAIYKPMLIVLSVWLFISIILFFIIYPPKIHLFTSIALAWLIATIAYGYNFTQQIQFNHQRFADHSPHLNEIDRRLSIMAERINESIILQDNKDTPKVMIIGSDDFGRKRLNFHLLHFNVGLIGDYQEILNSLERPNHYAVLLPPYIEFCEKNQQQDMDIVMNILLLTGQFCLLK